MPLFPMLTEPRGTLLTLVWVFAAGAVVVAVVSALLRAALTAALERCGHRLDLWRRVWFHPEREVASLVEGFLVVAYVSSFVGHYALPVWVLPAVAGVWGLHLRRDLGTWLRIRLRPHRTRELHERGFLLLDLGPLWLRVPVLLGAAGIYFLPPLRAASDRIMVFLLTSLQGWLA